VWKFSELVRGEYTKHRHQGDFLSILLFFKAEESRLKNGGEWNKTRVFFGDLL
jgi:hypothetical protein